MNLRDISGNAFPELKELLLSEIGAIEIGGITADSRKAAPGSLFVAVAGTKADGAAYVKDAVAKGAVAIVSGHAVDADVPVLSVTDPRLYLSLAASRFYGKQPETMVAVTGTAGKTSVASFVRQIWAFAGHAAAQIGTTGVIAPGREDYGALTTP